MPLPTFTWCPAPGASFKRSPRLIDVRYGDGYAHRVTTGINIFDDTLSSVFNGDVDYVGAIDLFLMQNFLKGFYFEFFGNIVVTCDSWQVTWTDRGADAKMIGSLQMETRRAYNFQGV